MGGAQKSARLSDAARRCAADPGADRSFGVRYWRVVATPESWDKSQRNKSR
jgi:hypothetical protein